MSRDKRFLAVITVNGLGGLYTYYIRISLEMDLLYNNMNYLHDRSRMTVEALVL